MTEAFAIVHAEPGFLVGAWRNVSVTACSGELTIEQLRFVRNRALEKKYPGGYGAFALVHASSMTVSPEVRAAAEELTRSAPAQLRAIAHVIVAQGFAGAAMRAVANGVMALTRTTVASKTFAEPRPAASWLFAKLGEPTESVGTLAEGFVAELEEALRNREYTASARP